MEAKKDIILVNEHSDKENLISEAHYIENKNNKPSLITQDKAADEKDISEAYNAPLDFTAEDELFNQSLFNYEREKATEETFLIDKTYELFFEKQLGDLGITFETLQHSGIHLPTLHRLFKQTWMEKSLRFLASTSLIRILCLWLFLRKDAIRQQKLIEPPKAIKASSLAINAEGEPEAVEAETKETKTSPVSDFTLSGSIQKKCRFAFAIFTSGAVLLQSEPTRQRIMFASVFQETTSTVVSGVWGLFFSSLLFNSVLNFFLYPEEYADATTVLDKIFYLLKLPQSITTSLRNDLYRPTVWATLVTVPLAIGMMYGIRAAYQAKRFNRREAQVYLRHYASGFWNDVGGWMINTMIPDLIPAAAIFSILPQSMIQRTLERIKHAMVWNGKLSIEERLALFHCVKSFSRKHYKLTQMNALSTLAGIVNHIDSRNLALLKEAGIDQEVILSLLFIKTEALRELYFLANHYNLPHHPKSVLHPLPRYLHANYLLWMIAYPQRKLLQPLFFAYKGVKLYFTITLYYALITGIQNIYDLYQQEKDCRNKGMLWLRMDALNKYICSVCGDYPVFYRDIFTIEDCFSSYLALPRSLENLLTFISNRNNLTSFDLSQIKTLDLTSQTILLMNETLLNTFLHALKPKMSGVTTIIPFHPAEILIDFSSSFADFIRNSSVITLNWPYLSQQGLDLLANVLPSTQISSLELALEALEGVANLTSFVEALRYSKVNQLKWLYIFNDTTLQAIAHILPDSNIKNLSLSWFPPKTSAPSWGCLTLAKTLPASKLQYLSLDNFMYGFEGVPCIEVILNVSRQMPSNFTLDVSSRIQDTIFLTVLTQAFSNMSPLPLKQLILDSDIPLPQQIILDFIDVLPRSLLVSLKIWIDRSNHYNYSIIIPRLADAISRSHITNFGIVSNLGDEGAKLLASFLPTKLNKLIELDLSDCNIGLEGAKAIAMVLNQTAINALNLNFNHIGTGLEALAQVLPKTKICQLFISGNSIELNGIYEMIRWLNQSKLEVLKIGHNNITDEAAYKLIAEGLPGSQITELDLSTNNITNVGVRAIAQFLSNNKFYHGLWIDTVYAGQKGRALAQPPRLQKLTDLYLGVNFIGDEGILALCEVLSETNLSYVSFIFGISFQFQSQINISLFNYCGVLSNTATNTASSLVPGWPWQSLYQLYQASKRLFSALPFSTAIPKPSKSYTLASSAPLPIPILNALYPIFFQEPLLKVDDGSQCFTQSNSDTPCKNEKAQSATLPYQNISEQLLLGAVGLHLVKRFIGWVKTKWFSAEEIPSTKVIASRGTVLAQVSKYRYLLNQIEQQVAIQPVNLRSNLTWVVSGLEDYQYQIECLLQKKEVQISELEELKADIDHFRKEFKSELQAAHKEETQITARHRHQYGKVFFSPNIHASANFAILVTNQPSTELPAPSMNCSLSS